MQQRDSNDSFYRMRIYYAGELFNWDSYLHTLTAYELVHVHESWGHDLWMKMMPDVPCHVSYSKQKMCRQEQKCMMMISEKETF